MITSSSIVIVRILHTRLLELNRQYYKLVCTQSKWTSKEMKMTSKLMIERKELASKLELFLDKMEMKLFKEELKNGK